MEDDTWRWSVGVPGLMRSARGSYASAIQARLAEAGFDDLPRNGGFALALLIHVGDLSHLSSDLGVSKRVLGDLIDAMVMRGYLERGAPSEDGGPTPVTPTERGRAAERIMAETTARIDSVLQERLGDDGFEAFRDGLLTLVKIHADRG